MERLALSITEAAKLISLSPWTIRKWIKQGKLTATRLGRRVCVTPDALRDLIDQGSRSKPTRTSSKR
jgi:excisionase family DNA binding protein